MLERLRLAWAGLRCGILAFREASMTQRGSGHAIFISDSGLRTTGSVTGG